MSMITIRQEDGGIQLVMEGRLSIEEAPVLLKHVMDNMDELTAIHMGGVESIGTAVVQILLMADYRMRKAGRRLSIVEPSDEVLRAMDDAGLSETLGLTHVYE